MTNPAVDAFSTSPESRLRFASVPRLAAGAMLGMIGFLVLSYPFRAPEDLAVTPLFDDGFYALSVARYMALGHGITIDGIHPTNGFQPLWVFLLSPIYAFVGGNRAAALPWVVLFASLIWAAFGIELARLAHDRARSEGVHARTASAIALILALGTVATFRICHTGMETGLHLLLLTRAVRHLDAPSRQQPIDIACTSVLLALLCYARLDAALFVAAFGAYAAWESLRTRSIVWSRFIPCGVAALALLPWLLYDLRIDGHLMPTSGRSESVAIDPLLNARATLLGLCRWLFPVVYRIPYWVPLATVVNVGLGALGLAVLLRAGRPRPRLGVVNAGTAALYIYVALLVAFYTLAFGAPHFQERYLAPAFVAIVPLFASKCAPFLRARPRVALAAVAFVAIANVPLLAIYRFGGFDRGGNTMYSEQTQFALTHVDPACTIGAMQSGTVGYFRDRVINLDGKVNAGALVALQRKDLRSYVDANGVDVVIDWPPMVRRILGPGATGFTRAGSSPAFETWVRQGREFCIRP